MFVYMDLQNGVDGVYARIECLNSVGFQSYAIGDEVVCPVTDIFAVISAPAVILRKNLSDGSSTLCTLTMEVCMYIENFCILIVHFSFVPGISGLHGSTQPEGSCSQPASCDVATSIILR